MTTTKAKATKATKKKAASVCPVCGKGELKYFARAGRMYSYKGFDYPISASMKLVECTNCHEMPMTPAEIEAVEGPIAEHHQQRMADLLDKSLTKLTSVVPVGEIEEKLHLSQGYLARARKSGEPSFQLAALLQLLAEDPKKLSSVAKLGKPARP
jgi:hypothetical protein